MNKFKAAFAEFKNRKGKISWKNWSVIWIAGFVGQLCWNIENQWFNTFVYEKIAPDPSIITWMVAVSAIVSTLSTFMSGTLSDRLGKRRPFMGIGYILWGIFTIVFGTTEFLRDAGANIMAIACAVVVADALMSFFGSFGNDAGYNPWTTDISNERNRGTLGAVIAILPVIATIFGSLVFGYIIMAVDYMWFFVILGGFVSLCGIYCFFAVKESPTLKPSVDPKGYWHQLGTAFNFKEAFKDKLLLWVLLIFAAFFISFNVYFSHILNYFIYTLGYDEGPAGVIMGVGLIIAIPATLVAGKYLNRGKFIPILIISVIVNIAGLLIIQIPHIVGLIAGIALVGAGYMCVYQALMVWVKNLYPEDKRGQFEGIRLLFYVCIPMVIGPQVGNAVIKAFGKTITNDYGISGYAPTNELFYVSAAFALLTFIPIYFAYRELKKRKQNAPAPETIEQEEPKAE